MKSGGGAVLLRLDFLTVLEDEADIVGAVDDGIFDKQLFIYMRKIQKRKSELIKSVSVALRFIRSSRGLGRKTSGGRLLCADRSGTETSTTSKNAPGIYRGTACQLAKKKGFHLR